ncbi:MAG TPA: L-seryl-tRNA(Sec) selenium transferase, partial [Thermodesulfobacteriota bacterium]|nr:L-seryl-tRNA(Sec) selenium transferase [Thermodesulfobacteriota bacterium]
MSPSLHQQALRKIPSVDEILSKPEVSDLLRTYPRSVVIEAIRSGLQKLREQILGKKDPSEIGDLSLTLEHLHPLFQKEIDLLTKPRLRRVINATGVVIHTNLGRSPLHPAAIEHLIDVSKNYSNLEYDLALG